MQKINLIGLGCCLLAATACTSRKAYQPCEIIEETYVHKYGVEVDPEDWNQRGQNGKVVTKLHGGITQSSEYKNGIMHGETTYTFPHSNTIEKVVVYEGGVKIKEICHDLNGMAREEILFKGDNKRLITKWYDTGAPECKEIWNDEKLVDGEYLSREQKLKARVDDGYGTRIVRNDYGEVDCQEKIEGGICSLKTTYHSNGNPKEIIPYKKGVVDGIKSTFFKYGEPNQEETWVNGEQTGITTVYKHGMRYAEVPYVNGVKQGIEKRYYNGEILEEEVCWKDGKMHGPNHTFVSGKVKTDWYLYGKPVTKQKYDFQTRSIFH